MDHAPYMKKMLTYWTVDLTLFHYISTMHKMTVYNPALLLFSQNYGISQNQSES